MNKVILIGKVGNDPDIRHTPSGSVVGNFSLATSKKYKGEEQTEWHKIVVFNKTAELVQSYVKKGSKLALEGEIKSNKWEDKQGNKRESKEIICHQLEFLDSQKSGGYSQKQDSEDFDDDIPF